MKLTWKKRLQPLQVEGCLAEGAAGGVLRGKLRERSGLRAVEIGDLVVALGSEPPWVEGAVFLGREGNLYLPTLWEPELPISWVEAGLKSLGEPPWVLLPDGRVIGLSEATVP